MSAWMLLGLLTLGQGSPDKLAPVDPPNNAPVPVAAPPAKGGENLLPPPKLDPKPLRKPILGERPEPGSPIGKEITAAPLTIDAVMASVDQFFPRIRAAEQERAQAAALQLSARGAWDLNLRSQELFNGGTYDSQRYSLFVDQITPFQGISYFAGYRLGAGDYPVYYGDRKTADGGEFRAGASIPLLRNREIDRFRATVAKADLDRQIAEPNILRQRIEIARSAARAYFFWVAAGQRYLIDRDLLRVAQERDRQLAGRVEAGNLADFEREDNRRLIVTREANLIASLRIFQQASIALSIFSRDASGRPLIPTLAQIPPFYVPNQPPDQAQFQKDLDYALANRPEIIRLALAREKVNVDIRLAENQLLPGLNLVVAGQQDMGFGKRSPSSTSRLDRQTGEAGVVFDVPLQRRDARGRILAGQAELARIAFEEQFAREQITVELQDAANALQRAYDLLRKGRDVRLQTEYIEQGERRRFDVGQSDLLRVNLREQDTLTARVLEIQAAAEFYRALADYEAARGVDPSQFRGPR
ncbi:MAG: TolC family protein [Gemmataceae bacterium]